MAEEPKASDAPCSPSGLDRDIRTPHRQELRAWFQRNACSLGEVYEGAVRLIHDSLLPGRVRFVSHAVREIRNRLPEIVSGIKAGNFQYKNRVDDLARAWRTAGFSPEGSVFGSGSATRSGTTTVPDPDVRVPRNLFLKIDALVQDHEAAR